jgi:hypothetical protein
MRRPVRSSRPFALLSLTALVAATVFTMSPAAVAAGPRTEGAHASALTRRPDVRIGSRGSIDVGKLAGSGTASAARPQLPFLSSPSITARATAATDPGQVKPFAATAPVLVTPASDAPATGPAWDGFSFADALAQPPDPWVAVGPEHVVQTVNTVIQMFDRGGTIRKSQQSIGVGEFFALPSGFGNSDPRIIYDSLHGRWVGTEVSWTCDNDADGTADDPAGFLDFIVSRTADPTGVWDSYYFGYLDFLPDFPAPGTSTDKLAFTANFFELQANPDCTTGALFAATELIVTDWPDVLAQGGSNGQIEAESFAFNDGGDYQRYFTARAAVQLPATSATLHVIAMHAGLAVDTYYVRVTGTVAAGNIAFPFETDLTTDSVVAESIAPPDPAQPSPGGPVVASMDPRPTDAIWQNGLLTWVATNGCTPLTDTAPRACVRVTQLNTGGAMASPPTRTQDFLVNELGTDNYYGGIGQAGNGTLDVVWTRSSAMAGDQPASQTAYQLPTDPANSLTGKAEIADGIGGEFTGGRWGDFVGVAQDPQVPDAVWQANQYATGGSNWQTVVSQLQTGGATYVPIDPLRVLDSRIDLGVTGIFNASTPKSFTVAGFTSTGGSIPFGAIAVTGNVTVTGQTAAGYASVTTTPTSTPGSSTLNFPTKDTRANNVTTPVASNGTLSVVYKAAAGKKAHIVFDVTGYFLPGTEDAAYNTLAPVRVLDSRVAYGIGLTNRFHTGVPRKLVIAGTHGVPANAVAVTANLTVVGQTKGGYVSVTPTRVPNPTTSNINFPVGDTRANGLTAKLGGTSIWLVYKGSAAGSRTDLVLDITGYYLPDGDGLLFHPLNPGRIMDTRISLLSGLTGTFNHNASRALDTDGHWGVPVGAKAVTGNLTVTGQTRSGYVSITPDPDPAPTTSTINFPLGDNRANGVTVPLSGSGNMSLIYEARSGKTTHLVLDVTGYFE